MNDFHLEATSSFLQMFTDALRQQPGRESKQILRFDVKPFELHVYKSVTHIAFSCLYKHIAFSYLSG